MNDIRRSVLWVAFCFSMILLWDRWQLANGKPATFFPSLSATATPAASTTPGHESPKAAQARPADVAAVAPASDIPHIQHVLTTDLFKLTFDSAGGSLIGADLLTHRTTAQDAQPLTLLKSDGTSTYVAQTGLVGAANSTQAWPNHQTPMRLAAGDAALKAGQDIATVRFESAPQNGIQLIKTYTVHRGSYEIEVAHEVKNVGDAPASPKLYVQLMRDGSKGESGTPFYSTFTGPAVYTQEAKYQKVDFDHINKNKIDIQKQSNNGYVAMVQHYFASAWVLPEQTDRENFIRKTDDGFYSVGTIQAVGELAAGQSKSLSARLFLGPQEEKILENVTPGLELVKDYGWLTMLAKPLYWLMVKIHSLVLNWGWSIVLLVVLIKAAFYWLNATAYRSMAKMKAVNPRIMEMRERLKDNPQQMQMEMLRIYREEKVNPIGGCLPVMIQIPVFMALYWVMLSSIEMRHAPWMGWITDLSSKDPLFILPVIMAITTLIQTSLNPLPPDPMQAKMMWLMPMLFSVMFFFFPSGLVLYWITNNVLTIAQQAFINHQLGTPMKFSMPNFKA